MAIRNADVVALGSMVGAVAATMAVYARLPDRVATHFDLYGVANGWMSRPVAAWLVPGIALGTWLLVRFGARALPVGAGRIDAGTAALLAAATTVFQAGVHVLVLRHALVGGTTVVRGTWLGLGALWIVLGLVLPRIRRNAFAGVRTPWTLASDENWARTHRVAGYSMTLAGAVALLAGLHGGAAAGSLALTAVIGGALVPVAYSGVYAYRTRGQG